MHRRMTTSPQPRAIRRGISNVRANWQVAALYLIAASAMALIAAALSGPVTSRMLAFFTKGARPTFEALMAALTTHWLVACGLASGLLALSLAALYVHAFIAAGSASTYVAGERAAVAARAVAEDVPAYRVFTWSEWWRAARSGVWRVVGVYLIVFAFVALDFAAFFIFAGASALSGCLGAIYFLASFLIVFAAVIGTPKAVVITVASSLSPWQSLRLSYAQMLEEPGPHIVAFVAVGICAGLLTFATDGLQSGAQLLTRMASPDILLASSESVLSLLKQAVAALVACWTLAIMTALTDPPVELP